MVEHFSCAWGGIPLWIHGHTHHNVDYHLGVTRALTNQRGYPQEICAGFDPGMVIEIEPATPPAAGGC
jgi:hypothetical protein